MNSQDARLSVHYLWEGQNSIETHDESTDSEGIFQASRACTPSVPVGEQYTVAASSHEPYETYRRPDISRNSTPQETHSEHRDIQSSFVKQDARHCCPIPDCFKTYLGIRQLQRHLLKHTKPDKYSCTVEGCKKTAYRIDAMSSHIRVHEKRVREELEWNRSHGFIRNVL
jgi:hypothetical protein